MAAIQTKRSWCKQTATAANANGLAFSYLFDVKKNLLEEMRKFRYGRDDYVWVSNYNSVLISHPERFPLAWRLIPNRAAMQTD